MDLGCCVWVKGGFMMGYRRKDDAVYKSSRVAAASTWTTNALR